jgi:hypothetical protein
MLSSLPLSDVTREAARVRGLLLLCVIKTFEPNSPQARDLTNVYERGGRLIRSNWF